MKNCVVLIILLAGMFSASAQQGFVRGNIFDAGNSESLPAVAIVVKGTTMGTTTDLDGKFSLGLAPGTYQLEISFISYQTIELTQVEVKAGQVTFLGDIQMKEEGFLLTEVTISANEVRNNENSIIAMKRKSVTMLDGVSLAAIRRTGDSDVASTMKRVTGVSVSGGKYVYVRGLGDRYTKTILNGMEIPGLDPDRNTVQMDLFPTNMIDNIVVSKTFSADLPADFTGGIINIETKDFPETHQAALNIGLAYNPGAHFTGDFVGYKGGATDFLGFDDGTRAIPAVTNIPFFAEVVGNTTSAKAERYKEILSAFNPVMAATRQTSLCDFSLGANFGNQKELKTRTLGYNFAFSYKNSSDYYENAEYGRYGLSGDKSVYELDRREFQTGDYGVKSVFVNVLGGIALKTNTSKYRMNIMHLQNGESKAGIFDYEKTSLGTNFSGIVHTLDYSQRSLTNLIIDGKHVFSDAQWNLEWKLSPTISLIYDPDIRFTRYEDREGVYSISTESGFPERIWRRLFEYNISSLVNATKGLSLFGQKAVVGFGGAFTYKQRDFVIRNFAINIRGVNLTGDPNEIFADENLWPMNGSATQGTTYETPFIPVNPNKYNANILSAAVYTSLEFSLFNRLKTTVGLRAENYIQRYTGRDQMGYHVLDNDVVLSDLGIFPSVNAIFTISDKQNLRAAFSKTIARPSFKELSYAEIFDPITGRTFIGGLFRDANDLAGIEYWDGNLTTTTIYNYDLRWELFGSDQQLISVSAFYKKFINPIEIVQFATQIGAFQPRNVGDGEVAGAEFEFRKNMKWIAPALQNLSLQANFTYTKSRILLSATELESRTENARSGQQISAYRDMAGQATYVVNAGISYKAPDNVFGSPEAGVYYNVQGPTLMFAGIADRPDIWSKPFHSLNFNANVYVDKQKKMLISLKVDNILNSKQEAVFTSYMAEDRYFSRLSAGRLFQIKYTWNF